jgi:hypothetical protein
MFCHRLQGSSSNCGIQFRYSNCAGDWSLTRKVGQIRKGHLVATASLLLASFFLVCTSASTKARADAGLLLGAALILSNLPGSERSHQ